MLRSPLKGSLKMMNSELYNLSTPLLIRSNNGYTMNSRLSHKTPLSLSVPKKNILKKNEFYTLVLISGQLLQNVKNIFPCVCYLLNFWPILDLLISKRVS